ncbi:hypothetical protein Pen01_75440 [Phytomonospora endophytica]|nr:hypothetical protein Pen01_75440 [Phytomonospora endophytica]
MRTGTRIAPPRAEDGARAVQAPFGVARMPPWQTGEPPVSVANTPA